MTSLNDILYHDKSSLCYLDIISETRNVDEMY